MTPTRTRGFTLIELLIAMAMTAAVMAAVGGILVSTLEAEQHVAESLATEKTGYGILTLLRHDIESCYAYGLPGAAFQGERGFEGSGQADKLAFVAAVEQAPDPKTGRRAKLLRVGYRLKTESGGAASGLSLYRKAEAYAGGDPLAPGPHAIVASGIKSLKLAYLDPKDRVWRDSDWKETDRLPLAVKISLELVPEAQKASGQQSFAAVNPATQFQAVVSVPVVLALAPDPAPPPQ